MYHPCLFVLTVILMLCVDVMCVCWFLWIIINLLELLSNCYYLLKLKCYVRIVNCVKFCSCLIIGQYKRLLYPVPQESSLQCWSSWQQSQETSELRGGMCDAWVWHLGVVQEVTAADGDHRTGWTRLDRLVQSSSLVFGVRCYFWYKSEWYCFWQICYINRWRKQQGVTWCRNINNYIIS